MSELPNPNQSRAESYLGDMIDQEGAIKPDHPRSRIEEYLEYIIEHGGGGEISPATADRLGGVKIGAGINVEEDGTISTSGGGGAVESVNGQTGEVVLDYEDVGALSENTRIPTKTSDLTNDSGFLTTVKETDIKWGDAVKDGITPLDFAAYNEFNPNRLAYMLGSQITVEKSTDGGTTWTDYGGLTDKNKQSLVTLSHRLYTGGAATGTGTGNRLRVTISSYSGLYLRTKKLLVNVTTNGTSGPKMMIEHSTIGTPDVFTTYKTVDIGGWPGWNSVPYEFVFGGTTQAAQLKKLRLTFYYSTAASSGNQLILDQIRLLGSPAYNTPSTIANTGHMYTYDIDKNVTFPGKIIASNIPDVTSADEGKILKVVNGVPTWVTA